MMSFLPGSPTSSHGKVAQNHWQKRMSMSIRGQWRGLVSYKFFIFNTISSTTTIVTIDDHPPPRVHDTAAWWPPPSSYYNDAMTATTGLRATSFTCTAALVQKYVFFFPCRKPEELILFFLVVLDCTITMLWLPCQPRGWKECCTMGISIVELS